MDLVLRRNYDDGEVTIDLEDHDDVYVDYKKGMYLSEEEQDEINKLIDIIVSTDFTPLHLQHFYPKDMQEIVYNNLYILDIEDGSLVYQNNQMFFISYDTKVELRRDRKSNVRSNLGGVAVLDNFLLEVGDYIFPYTFDLEYLKMREIPNVNMIPNNIPLDYNSGSMKYTKFENNDGIIYIFTYSADEAYQMYLPKDFTNTEDLAGYLFLLDVATKEDILYMLS